MIGMPENEHNEEDDGNERTMTHKRIRKEDAPDETPRG